MAHWMMKAPTGLMANGPRRAMAQGKVGLALLGVALLSGCASLPISGPTGRQVFRATEEGGEPQFKIISVANVAQLPAPPASAPQFADDTLPSPTDLVGQGDVLDVQIYEAGVTLFAGSRMSAAGAATSTGSAQAERLPALRVDDKGEIFVPFVGRLRAAGHTTGELADMIRRGLRGLSQDPQVVVSLSQSLTNSVILGGELARPGRLALSTNRETLSEVIALAGGYRGEAKDIAVQITRAGLRQEFRLAEVMSGPQSTMRVHPADRIDLIKRPQTFAVLGAAGRVEQLNFTAPANSLAEALAQAGGPNPNLGDAKAVFVFRFEKDAQGVEKPTVYHINMMNPGSVFLAQRFMMRDKDVLYVGNAAANQPSKLIQLVSQMFSPIVAVQGALVNTGTI
jgi:polysaccharide export outer membrane protein